MSSYLHCPTCRCAYNVATTPACPGCGVRPGAPADPVDDVVAAAEQLARAVARATPGQLACAQAELAMRDAAKALPAPGATTVAPPSLLRAVRHALAPRPPAPPPIVPPLASRGQQALLTTIALALLARVPRPTRRPSVRAWATERVLPRLAAAGALLARN